MTKRRLTRIRLDKIAAVDLPCQEHATVAILKRAPTPLSIAKATFAEALQAAKTESAVESAMYQAFDGLWERNNAFRTALTDELADGGDGSTASEDYVASVKALVDAAVGEARQAGASAADTSGINKALSTAVDGWLESKEDKVMKITNRAELQAAVSGFAIAKSTVADALAIQAAAKALNAEDELPADGPLALAKADPAVAQLQRELAILKLSPEAKTHFDGLGESEQTAFLAKSADQQAADIAKRQGDDPVVYTTAGGVEIRKSAGAAMIAMAKSHDELAKRLGVAEGNLSGSTIEKRAAEEFPNVAKGTAVAMLKSAKALGEDTDEGKDVLKSLNTMQTAGARLSKRIGTDEGGETDNTDIAKGRQDFDAKVTEIAKRDQIGRAPAMTKAREEFPDLFKAAYPEQAADAEAREVDAAVAA
jgi:hypothetical protein